MDCRTEWNTQDCNALIALVERYHKHPRKYIDMIVLESNPKTQAVLMLGLYFGSIVCPINPQTGIVEKHKPQMSDLFRYYSMQRSMEEQGWLTLFGISC